jgi:excisionase family DNA binding protein
MTKAFSRNRKNCTNYSLTAQWGYKNLLAGPKSALQGGGMETYLTIPELAALLKLSEQTIRRYVLNDDIPYHKVKKVIRFRPSEIERWVESSGLDTSVNSGAEQEQGDLFADLQNAGEAAREQQ